MKCLYYRIERWNNERDMEVNDDLPALVSTCCAYCHFGGRLSGPALAH